MLSKNPIFDPSPSVAAEGGGSGPQGGAQDVRQFVVGTGGAVDEPPEPGANLEARRAGRRGRWGAFFWFVFFGIKENEPGRRQPDGTLSNDQNPR